MSLQTDCDRQTNIERYSHEHTATQLVYTSSHYLITNHICRYDVCIHIGWSDVTVIYGHDTISMLQGMMSYCAKLTGYL